MKTFENKLKGWPMVDFDGETFCLFDAMFSAEDSRMEEILLFATLICDMHRRAFSMVRYYTLARTRYNNWNRNLVETRLQRERV
jgi:hypothetical protein